MNPLTPTLSPSTSLRAGRQGRGEDKGQPINAKQIQIIHVAAQQIGLSEERYRQMLADRYGVVSCKDLSYRQAHDLIEHIRSLGFQIRPKPRKPSGRPRVPGLIYLPSPQQMAMIAHLREDIRWRYQDGYARWIRKFLRRGEDTNPSRPLIRTSAEAYRVIEAMKAMRERQQGISPPGPPAQGEAG